VENGVSTAYCCNPIPKAVVVVVVVVMMMMMMMIPHVKTDIKSRSIK
jgi:hypothetical protein